jgi:predicted porin
MNKKILAATIAAAVAAPTAALANDVTVYGVAHLSIDYLTADYSQSFPSAVNAENGWDGWDVASRASRLGFKGTEDLSNGLKAIWKMEFQVDMADAGQTGPGLTDAVNSITRAWDAAEAGTITDAAAAAATVNTLAGIRGTALGFLGSPTVAQGSPTGAQVNQQTSLVSARNMYVGLAGGFGTFLVGRHDTPYKMSTGSLDMFADTLADYNSTLLFTDIRTGSAIAYVSPAFGGLTLSGAIVAPHIYTSANTTLGTKSNDADGLAEAYSLAAVYNANGFFASAAYESISNTWYQSFYGVGDADLDTDGKWRVGLGWTGAGFTLGAIYEDQSNVLGFSDTEKQSWQIQAGYTFGNNQVKAMYGQVSLDWLDKAITEDWASWAVGLDHNFSKRTKAYMLYTNVNQDLGSVIGDADVGGFSVGMIHSF